ncbi:MAG: hypothetical protein KBS43_06015 [Oscillospiraceae bacterium]|nr:hypothetical protein [Candidatus Limimonas coprohippi]
MGQRKLFIRIVCIFMAALMLIGVLAVLFQAIAMGPETINIVMTGDNNNKHTMLIIAIIAVVILLGVTVAPALIKKIKK